MDDHLIKFNNWRKRFNIDLFTSEFDPSDFYLSTYCQRSNKLRNEENDQYQSFQFLLYMYVISHLFFTVSSPSSYYWLRWFRCFERNKPLQVCHCSFFLFHSFINTRFQCDINNKLSLYFILVRTVCQSKCMCSFFSR